MQSIDIQREIPASPERVWDLISDHRGWADWAGAREVVLRSEGDPAPNGVGAIRVMRGGGLAIEEEIVRFEPPHVMGYRIAAGLPVKNYEAEIRLEPGADGGTHLRWTSSFDSRIPLTGPLLRLVLTRTLSTMAAALSRRLTG